MFKFRLMPQNKINIFPETDVEFYTNYILIFFWKKSVCLIYWWYLVGKIWVFKI